MFRATAGLHLLFRFHDTNDVRGNVAQPCSLQAARRLLVAIPHVVVVPHSGPDLFAFRPPRGAQNSPVRNCSRMRIIKPCRLALFRMTSAAGLSRLPQAALPHKRWHDRLRSTAGFPAPVMLPIVHPPLRKLGLDSWDFFVTFGHLIRNDWPNAQE